MNRLKNNLRKSSDSCPYTLSPPVFSRNEKKAGAYCISSITPASVVAHGPGGQSVILSVCVPPAYRQQIALFPMSPNLSGKTYGISGIASI